MPITSSQQKTSQPFNISQISTPRWKTVLLEKKRHKKEFPQWKLDVIKRKSENSNDASESNIYKYDILSATKKKYSSVPCLSTFQDEQIYEDLDKRIVPIRINPIVILDQEKKRFLSIEEKNNFMIEKVSHEICRENKLDGEMEYGKGFVGKLLKKFNSFLNISNLDKNVENSNVVKDPRLSLGPPASAENKTRSNNCVALDLTSKDSNMNESDSVLNRCSYVTSQCDPAKQLPEEDSCLAVSVNNFNDNNLYEEIYSVKSDFNFVSVSTHFSEEMPRHNQVRDTKSVFENISTNDLLKSSGLKDTIKSRGNFGNNSKFYGRQKDEKPSDNCSRKNLPDILLSSSPQMSIKSLTRKVESLESSSGDVKSKIKIPLDNSSEIKEGPPTSRSETVSTSTTKQYKPGSLVIRPSSNAPVSLLEYVPYKDIRASTLNEPMSSEPHPRGGMNRMDVYSSPTPSKITSISEFGPESYVISGEDKIPMTNIDNFLYGTSLHDDCLPDKIRSTSSTDLDQWISTPENASTTVRHPSQNPSKDDLQVAAPSPRVKSLLLDSPRPIRGTNIEEDADLPDDLSELAGGKVTFAGAGIIHTKSALAKSRGPKRKMSVTFLDPSTDAQVFEYPAEESFSSHDEQTGENNDFTRPAPSNFGHLSSYRSKMHVDFEFGSSVQRENYGLLANNIPGPNTNPLDQLSPNISTPWSSSMSVDLMF